MSRYTIELRKVIQAGADIGLKDYPVPNYAADNPDAWRERLNRLIISHYSTWEIGCTPIDRFIHYLNNTMNEIMPMYALLYEAMHDDFKVNTTAYEETENTVDTLTGDTQVDNTQKSTSSVNKNTTVTSSDFSLSVESNTPGQMLNTESEIQANIYASNAEKQKTSGDEKTTGTDTTTTDASGGNKTVQNLEKTNTRVKTVKGVYGKTYSQLFMDYQKAVRNLDMEVIKELQPCFMGVL